MELTDLSSNWKKLQQTLKQQAGSDHKKEQQHHLASRKRKASSHAIADFSTVKPPKRPKPSPKMGLTSSRTFTTTAATPLAPTMNGNKPPATSTTTTSFSQNPPTSTVSPPSTSDLLSCATHPSDTPFSSLHPHHLPHLGKYLSLDCEMIGVGLPPPRDTSALARVSAVSYTGHLIYDALVLPNPKEPVTDYRTQWSGITPELLAESGRSFAEVQKDVAGLLDGRVLVGHAVENDLAALMLGHPRRDVRDTSRYGKYRKLAGGRTPGLRKLAKDVLGWEIQGAEHSSIEDARAAMALFRRERIGFEKEFGGGMHTGDGKGRVIGKRGKRVVLLEVEKTEGAFRGKRAGNDEKDGAEGTRFDMGALRKDGVEEKENEEDDENGTSDVGEGAEVSGAVKAVKVKKSKKKKKKKGKYR